MTDQELARALLQANGLERELRATRDRTFEAAERENTIAALRHATALRKALEGWMGARAVRGAQVAQTT